MISTIIPEDIDKMTYPDFVAFLGQKNTPPGGLHSVKRWIDLAGISKQSRVLDLACSNGFSSREAAKMTQCSGIGIDISGAAISVAIQEAEQAGLSHLLHYQVGDAANLSFQDQFFSHILGGCNFSFIENREQALFHCRRTLQLDGKLCVANFYYTQPPSEILLDSVQESIGFRPQAFWNYDWWNQFFTHEFSLIKEEIKALPVTDEGTLKTEIQCFVFDKSPYLHDASLEIKKACAEKLFKIRRILNEHRRYQNFSISIWG